MPQSKPTTESVEVSVDHSGTRVDLFLAQTFKDHYSRSYFQHLIQEGMIAINERRAKKAAVVETGDTVTIIHQAPDPIQLKAENIPLDILYEDDELLAINKPAGLVVHPAPGNRSGTFANALCYHLQMDAFDQDDLRPGIIHRLDKETTGVLIAAKTPLAYRKMQQLFAGREVDKEYLAIVIGNPSEGEVIAPIGRHPVQRKQMAVQKSGRHAHTQYTTISRDGDYALVRLKLFTGRTHQARVHMQHLGTPILGDPVYGSKKTNAKFKIDRQLLHARRLCFTHPFSKMHIEILAPIPQELQHWIHQLCEPSSKEY